MINATRRVLGKLTLANPAAGALMTAAQVDRYSSVIITGLAAATTYTIPAPTNADVVANSQELDIKNASTSTADAIITIVGGGTIRIRPGRHETLYYDTVGAGWYAETDDEATPTKLEQALVVGATNTFTHNLNLVDPNRYLYTLTHIATGQKVDVDLVSTTANTVVFFSNTALTLCRLNIIG